MIETDVTPIVISNVCIKRRVKTLCITGVFIRHQDLHSKSSISLTSVQFEQLCELPQLIRKAINLN